MGKKPKKETAPVEEPKPGTKPIVYLYGDPDRRGKLVQKGPEQSVVKWENGNETVVVNTWIRYETTNEAPETAPRSEPTTRRTTTKVTLDPKAKIRVLVDNNPHRTDSKDYRKFATLNKSKLTVAAALKAGVDQGYLNYSVKRKLIAIE